MAEMSRGSALAQISKDLRTASDQTILRVTEVIDAMPERGLADRLLDPVRGRLAAVAAPRPISFTRQLFTPIDPLIVSTTEWRPGAASIPRSLLKPLAGFIEQQLDARPLSAAFTAAQGSGSIDWAASSAILASIPLPVDWSLPAFQTQTGISHKSLPGLVEIVRLVFTHAGALLEFASGEQTDIELLRPLLQQAARSGPLGWRCIVSLLVERSFRPAPIIGQLLAMTRESRVAQHLNTAVQQVLENAIDRLDDEVSRVVGKAPPTEAAIAACTRHAARLSGFGGLEGEMQSLSHRIGREKAKWAAKFSDQMEATIQALAKPTPNDQAAQDEAAIHLETMLAALQRLGHEVRPLGGQERRDRILNEAANFYAGPGAPDWLTRGEKLRLCEILVGPEAALQKYVGPQVPYNEPGSGACGPSGFRAEP